MPEVAVHVVQHENSKKRPFHSSFLLISVEPLFFVHTRCLLVGHVITELFVLENGGCKVNEMPFNSQCSSVATAIGQ